MLILEDYFMYIFYVLHLSVRSNILPLTYLFPLVLICLHCLSRVWVWVRIILFPFSIRLVKPSLSAPPLQLLFHWPVELTAHGQVVQRATWEVMLVSQCWAVVSQRTHATSTFHWSVRPIPVVWQIFAAIDYIVGQLRRPEGWHILPT